jgi:hypothetical protein
MIELRSQFPAQWLVLLGDHHSLSADPGPGRAELAAGVLGRPACCLDEEGHQRIILAAATQPLTDALAYVESRSHITGLPLTWAVVTWLPWLLATTSVLPEAEGLGSCNGMRITNSSFSMLTFIAASPG